MSIEARDIRKNYGSFEAVRDVSLEVKQGELVALLGPSGSGKTTLLRILAGLEEPDQGTVHLGGEDATHWSARDRRVGFVFQHYALFRHMTVFENIAFGLRVRPRRERVAEAQVRERVHELLALVQLEGFAGRLPAQLSGGQRQRVALARALAVQPRALLLDEPFGALDYRVRRELRRWLRKLHEELGVTSVFVTHDQEEALELADRVVLMNHGRIEQVGTPEDVYHRPATPFVLAFLGDVNLFHARVDGRRAIVGNVALPLDSWSESKGERAELYIRPHRLEVARAPRGGPEFRARVQRIHGVGPLGKLELLGDDGSAIRVELPAERLSELQLAAGTVVWVTPREKHVFFADREEPGSGTGGAAASGS